MRIRISKRKKEWHTMFAVQLGDPGPLGENNEEKEGK